MKEKQKSKSSKQTKKAKTSRKSQQTKNKGFKHTEIGLIPEDWDVKKLGEIGKCIRGVSYNTVIDLKEIDSVSTVRLLRSNNVQQQIIELNDIQFVSNTRVKPIQVLKENDIVISMANGSKQLVGKAAQFNTKDSFKYTFGAFMGCFRIYSNDANPKFVFCNFLSDNYRGFLHVLFSGSSINNLKPSDIESISIPFPNIEEQTRIATALNDADALIQKLEQLIAKKRNIKTGVMQELLKPKEGWEEKKLGEVAHIKTGSRNNEDKVPDGEYPFFVRSEIIEKINTYSYDCEAILVPGDGNIGEIFHYINGKFEVHQRVYKISDFKHDVIGKYVYLWLQMNFKNHAYKYTAKNTVDSLRLPIFKEFEISYPTLVEQTRIAQILSDMDNEIQALEKQLEKYKMIKQGMMQVLLTGKIRLI